MQQLLAQVNSQCGWDCTIKSFDGWSLCISSGTSPEYASPLVTFSGVTYISCPTEISHPKFRIASQVEREQVKCLTPLDESDFLVAIEAETMAGVNCHTFYIAAESGVLDARA
jgi:hypothetical protein